MGASHKSLKADITVVFNQSIESSNQSMNHLVTIFQERVHETETVTEKMDKHTRMQQTDRH